MRTKKILIFLLVLTTSYSVYAQKKEVLSQHITLKEAQAIALKKNPNLQIKSINATISKKKTAQARRAQIPEIYANFDMRRNLIIQTTPVPAKAFNPNAEEGEIMPLKFMTNWTSNAGLNANVNIFNPESHGQIEVARQQATIKVTEKKIAANQLRFQVGKDYAAVIIAQKQLELAIADTASKNNILAMTKAQYRAGRLKITDLNQIISQKNQSVSNYLKAVNVLTSAKAQLGTDLGLRPSQGQSLSLSDSISSLLQKFKTPNLPDEKSLTLQKWEQQKMLTEIQLQNAKLGYLPTISLKGFYGSNYFDNDFELFKGQNWYGNSYISLSVKIPITKDIEQAKKVEVLQLQHQRNQANLQAQKHDVQLAVFQAQQSVRYKSKDLLHKKKNLQLSKKNLQTATHQLSKGRLLIGDWTKSNYLYQKAKTDYLQAAYDLIVAKMKLQKVSRK